MATDATEEQRKKDHAAQVRRAQKRLEQLVTGWIQIPGLARHPDRDEILDGLIDADRKAVLTIEGFYLRDTEGGAR